jgi:hypothetical protein
MVRLNLPRFTALASTAIALLGWASDGIAATTRVAVCDHLSGQLVFVGAADGPDRWVEDRFDGTRWTFEWRDGQQTARLTVQGGPYDGTIEKPVIIAADEDHVSMLAKHRTETLLYTLYFRNGKVLASTHKLGLERSPPRAQLLVGSCSFEPGR